MKSLVAALVAAVLSLSALSLAQETKLSSGALKFSYEQLNLPGNETMGMAGSGVYGDFGRYFNGGLASYSAIRGERGGFITLGAAGGFSYPLNQPLRLDTGLYVGAGGGRGGYLLSGGGLYLRAHAGLNVRLASWAKVGGGVSYVDTPNGGRIHSTQPYVTFEIPFELLTRSGWDDRSSMHLSASEDRQLAPKAHEIAWITRRMNVSSGSVTQTGEPQRDFGMVGAQWRTYLKRNWFAQVESAGAAGGDSTGYMQILGGTGVRVPLASRFFAIATASLGAGGGGNVDTGGGLLLEGSAGLQAFVSKRWFVEGSADLLRSPTATFRAIGYGARVGYRLGESVPGPANPSQATEQFDSHDLRFRFVNQHYIEASSNWRTHNSDESVDNLGVQLDWFHTPHWFFTGQGLAAYNGNAGAYMTGLVGGGYHQQLGNRLFAEAEALGGAAGGGGLQMGSGFVSQGNASIGCRLTNALSVMTTAGEIRALNGNFRAHVLGVSLAYHFKAFTIAN